MNNQYITYHLHEVEEEIANIMLQLKINPDFTMEEYTETIQHIFHHLNLAWNGRDARENPTAAEVKKWSQFPTDIELI